MSKRRDDYDGWAISLPTLPEEKAQAQKGYKAPALGTLGAALFLAAPWVWTLTTNFAHLFVAAMVGYCTGFLLMDGLIGLCHKADWEIGRQQHGHLGSRRTRRTAN